MTSIQVCPYCHEPFNADKHKFGGYCSALHRTAHQRETGGYRAMSNRSNVVHQARINRFHGKDNRT